MKRFTLQRRMEIVSMYTESGGSIILTQRAYRRKYHQKAPSDNTIRRLMSNFLKCKGSLADRPHAEHQRPRRPKELVEAVRKSIAEDPTMSCRQRAKLFGTSGTTMRRIINDDLLISEKEPENVTDTANYLELKNKLLKMFEKPNAKRKTKTSAKGKTKANTSLSQEEADIDCSSSSSLDSEESESDDEPSKSDKKPKIYFKTIFVNKKKKL